MLGVLALLMPNLLAITHSEEQAEELRLSRFCAIILLSMYLAYLYFQLVSHRSIYDEVGSFAVLAALAVLAVNYNTFSLNTVSKLRAPARMAA